ncbi:MAG: hypothetical protein PHR77_03325 [Kiritimatiellae bacterium]|nr:hypothetical protein [Kiritimatiellia bacterium]MDD5519588.1 hypothetical protein [Kiritimatiellia bacterium]
MNAIVTKKQIDIFKSLFCVGRMDVYGTYYLDSGRCYVAQEPITREVIRKHLDGRIPMGVFMLKGDVTSLKVRKPY